MSKTQLESAKAGIVTKEMVEASQGEELTPEEIRDYIANGWVVIPKNKNRSVKNVKAIGKGLRTKVNANLGTSDEKADLDFEKRKLEAAIKAGTDSVMDLSTGGDLNKAREFFLENSPVMVGAVPIYGIASEMARKGRNVEEMTEEMIFDSIEQQCLQGVDYITVHCGVTQETAARLKYAERIMPCVSRGGSITLRWMRKNKKENPLYEHFDELLKIAHKYDVTLSLGGRLQARNGARCHRWASDKRTFDPWGTCQTSQGKRRPGDNRRPGPCTLGAHKASRKTREKAVQ